MMLSILDASEWDTDKREKKRSANILAIIPKSRDPIGRSCDMSFLEQCEGSNGLIEIPESNMRVYRFKQRGSVADDNRPEEKRKGVGSPIQKKMLVRKMRASSFPR
jgi:hypothetical protein